MSTRNIVKFLQTAYSDEKLAELLAHAQDGKLCWSSCCCFVGVLTADHALRGWAAGVEFDPISTLPHCKEPHYLAARNIPGADAAEKEFNLMGDDYDRRAALIPLILAEMERREKLAISILPSRQPLVRIPEGSDQGDEQPEDLGGYPDPAENPYAGVKL